MWRIYKVTETQAITERMLCDTCKDNTPVLGLEPCLDRKGRQRLTINAKPAFRLRMKLDDTP